MYRIGIDLGGTNIAAGVLNDDYEIIAKASVKTLLPRGAEEIADDMAKAALTACDNAKISIDDVGFVGIGSPGSVSPLSGTVNFSNNLGFNKTPLAQMISERLNKKCLIENDANAAAYGEALAGAGKTCKNFIMLTYGTGVGGGIIINGKIYSGSNYAGGEIGHMVICTGGEKCSCGRCGCYEKYASATALISQTKQAMLSDEQSKMWDLCSGDINNVSGITAFDGYRISDKTATDVINRYTDYVAAGITNIVNIFQPEKLCIGGGISNEGKWFTDLIAERVACGDYARNLENRVTIETAKLGNDAGIIGAAFLDKGADI